MPSDDDIALIDRRRLRWEPTNPDSRLGEGSFGIVYRGSFNGTPVAIKVVKRPPPNENASEQDKIREHAAMKQHRREIHRFEVVQNPHIIQYLGVFRGQNPRDLYIVTEFLEGGSLYESLSRMRARKAALDETSFLQVAKHIALGLNHVHHSQYTHGDMKPQNILLTSAFYFHEDPSANIIASLPESAKVKIADFGLSKRLDGAESASLFGSTTATTDFGSGPCGTYLYMSPEAYNGVSELSDSQAKAADIYAFGLVLFELLSGLQSWGLERVRNPMQLSTLVRRGERPAWGPREEYINTAYIDLVKRCWSHEASDRPTVDDIVAVLEKQQDAFKDSSAEPNSSPSTPFSQVTRHDGSSPESSSIHPDEYRKQEQALPPLPDYAPPPLRSTNTANLPASQQASEKEQPQRSTAHIETNNLIRTKGRFRKGGVRDDGRSNAEVVAEDDAHTVEDGEDIFASGERFLASIRKVESMRLTDTQVADCRVQQSQRYVKNEAHSDRSEGSESYSESEIEEEDESEEEGGSEGDKVCDRDESILFDPAYGGYHLDQNVMDSIVGPVQEVRKVNSIKLIPPTVDLPLPDNTAARPVWAMGTVDPSNGPQGQPVRSDSAMLNSFMGASLVDHQGEEETREKEEETREKDEKPSVFHTEDENTKESRHLDHDSQPKLDLGPAKAPPLPEPPAESGYETNSAATSHPQTPEETEASKAAALQRRANNYSSPNVGTEWDALPDLVDDEGSLSKAAAQLFPSDESHHQAKWSSGQRPVQNEAPIVTPSGHVGPSSAPVGNERSNFPTTTIVQNVPTAQPGHSHHPWISLTNQGASAPPLSDTSQSAVGVPTSQGHHIPSNMTSNLPSSAWPAPGSKYQPLDALHRMPRSNIGGNPAGLCAQTVDKNAVLETLQRPDAAEVLRVWWPRHARTVAAGLAQALSIGGEDLLHLVRQFLESNNRQGRDPLVAKDLCAAIGHIARNASQPLGRDAISQTVPVVLFVFPSFQPIACNHSEVYSFASFALCNLFKVYNVIHNPNVRTAAASWIAYAISWNVTEESNSFPYDEVLAYTATSAARNFMWMNEANVEAFIRYNSGGTPQMKLIKSMMYFDRVRRLGVVEVSLSAMAMIIHFPRQRVELTKVHGVKAVIEVLREHADNSGITSLAFWMITVLFSCPTGNRLPEDVLIANGFLGDGGCQGFVAALQEVSRRSPSEKQKVESLEKGYNALLTVARFSGSLRAKLIEAGCMPIILGAVRELALSSAEQSPNTDGELVKARRRLGVVVCALIYEMSNEQTGMSYMRDHNMSHPLQNMMQSHHADDGFTNCCRNALARLAY